VRWQVASSLRPPRRNSVRAEPDSVAAFEYRILTAPSEVFVCCDMPRMPRVEVATLRPVTALSRSCLVPTLPGGSWVAA